jgi:transcriptional regulator with PAS, ATPase and Fis domain
MEYIFQKSNRTSQPDQEVLLAQYRVRAQNDGVDPNIGFKDVRLKRSTARKQEWKNSYPAMRFDCFLGRYMDLMTGGAVSCQAAFLQIDKGGVLRRLFGNMQLIQYLQQNGIEVGTIWQLETLGPNAICVGLAENRPMFSIGKANYNRFLQAYAIYFSPITMQGLHLPFLPMDFGGIAAVVPENLHTPDYLMHVQGIAHDLILNMHFSQTANMLYERSGQGVLTIDSGMKNGHVTVTYCSQSLFALLNVEPFNLYFAPLDTLFDPLPQNQELWAIIQELREVENYSLTLTVRGHSIPCIISTDAYYQPNLNVQGIIFYITTARQISKNISAKMGNSAIFSFDNIIGNSSVLKTTVQRCRQVAQMDSNVMLLGESGVGKDLFAQSLHNGGSRRSGPFIAVNCGSLPRDLIASELFGYVGGAFTGAKREGNIGKFELANGGTIFLDEIGELPLDLQATLLRVVEEKRVTRLGSSKTVDINVRIVSATNADILGLVAKKLFRADLYYRLSTIRVVIPPLRERGNDIIVLAKYFISLISAKVGRSDEMTLAKSTEQLLLSLPWKGNVRELQNLFESIVQLSPEPVILPEHVLRNIQEPYTVPDVPLSSVEIPSRKNRAPVSHLNLTKEEIEAAIFACGNNKSAAARYLGISIRTLYRKIEKYKMK